MSIGATSGARRWRAAIGLGSNLDDPEQQILTAFEALDALPETRLLERSALYASPPWGMVEQPWFVNAVALVETGLSPKRLHQALKDLEDARGRRRDGPRWGPRVLDLDLLLFEDRTIDTPTLAVPHPRMTDRAFVMVPLAEVAGDWRLPSGDSVGEVCAQLGSAAGELRRIASRP